jgi:flavin-dependent dehydrogenase
LNRARAAGACIAESCMPIDAKIVDRKVRVSSNLGETESRILVDATGRNRWLARRWRLKTEIRSRPLILRYGYRRGNCPGRRDNPLFVSRRDGWDWTARVKPNLYQWISLRFERLKSSFQNVPTEIANLRAIGPERGADVTWRLVTEAASPRHFLVGDAAAVLDPSSSHGIIKALSSGILAATCIQKLLSRRSGNDAKVAEGYCAWQRKWFQIDAQHLQHLNNWDDDISPL